MPDFKPSTESHYVRPHIIRQIFSLISKLLQHQMTVYVILGAVIPTKGHQILSYYRRYILEILRSLHYVLQLKFGLK